MKAAFVIKRFCLSRLKSCSVAIQKGVDCCFENMNSNFEVWRRRKGWKQSAFLFSRCLEKMIFCSPGRFAIVIQKGVLFAFRMNFVVVTEKINNLNEIKRNAFLRFNFPHKIQMKGKIFFLPGQFYHLKRKPYYT